MVVPEHVIGIDVGGSKLTAALAHADGETVRLIRRRTEPEWTAQENIAALREMVEELLSLSQRTGADVGAIGIGFGGPVDPWARVIRRSHHVTGWEGVALADVMEAAFGIPTALDNDANVGALGELHYGAGRGHRDILYINIGTGIGGAFVFDGQLHHGASGGAGEIGHTIVLPDGPLCTCGKHGCLEALCSGTAIGRRAREALAGAGPEDTSLPIGPEAEHVGAEDVFSASQRGDPLAHGIILETARFLGIAIGNVLSLVGPELVILGGGVSEAGDALLNPVRQAVLRYAMPDAAQAALIVTAELGYDAGVLGAVALAAQHLSGSAAVPDHTTPRLV
jgi:glucokinase